VCVCVCVCERERAENDLKSNVAKVIKNSRKGMKKHGKIMKKEEKRPEK
jgi:hypothetical protein